MGLYNKVVALALLVSILNALPIGAQDGDTIQTSPYSSLQEIPSDIPVNPYNTYPNYNNAYPNYYNSSPGYYNGYPSYYNSSPGYYNGYQNRYSPYSPNHPNYQNQQYRNKGPYSGQGARQNREGEYGGGRGEDRGRGGR